MPRRITSGDVALKLNVDDIKAALGGKNLDAAMFLGGSVIRDVAEAKAGTISAEIADKMYVVTEFHVKGTPHKKYDALVKKKHGTVVVSSSSKKTHLLELGTKPHGNHPGTAAQPFLRPAIDESSNEARETITAVLREGLGKA